MTGRSRILTAAAIFVSVILIAGTAAFFTVRSPWFQDFVRKKIISYVEDSTGGITEIASFVFDWHKMTATATGFVIHGNEPSGADPLFKAQTVEVRLKLLPSFHKTVDLEYLGIDRPQTNIMVLADGRTNIPSPKAVTKPDPKAALESVVDLAVKRLDIQHGTAAFENRRIPFSARGRDLRIDMGYITAQQLYKGQISLNVAVGGRSTVDAQVTVPVVIEKTGVSVSGARIQNAQSRLLLDGSLRDLASPVIALSANLHLALEDLKKGANLPLEIDRGGPQSLDASIAVRSVNSAIEIQALSVGLGQTHFEASGNLSRGAAFHGSVSLEEAGRMLNRPEQPAGSLRISGSASLQDAAYLLSGNVSSSGISLKHPLVSGVQLTSSFRVDPKLLEISNLKLAAWGAEVTGAARLDDHSQIAASVGVRNLDLQTIARQLGFAPVGYSGSVSARMEAHGNVHQPEAMTEVQIAAGGSGIPVSGKIHARLRSLDRSILIQDSEIRLPNTRIALSGQPGNEAQIQIVSHNLADFGPAIAAFSSSGPQISGGAGTIVISERGPLSDPQTAAKLQIATVTVGRRVFDQIAAEMTASSSGVHVANGVIVRGGSTARFGGSVALDQWKLNSTAPISVSATVQNGELADFLALAGKSDFRASGSLTADASIAGTAGNPQGSVRLAVTNGRVYDDPFDQLQAEIDLTDQLMTVKSMTLNAGSASLAMAGSFAHPRDSFETGRLQAHLTSNQVELGQFQTLQEKRPGLAGTISLDGDLRADLAHNAGDVEFVPSAINATIHALSVRDRSQQFGDFNATVSTSGSDVQEHIDSNFAGSRIQVTGVTRLAKGYPTTADAKIDGLQVEKAISVMSSAAIPAAGVLSATARFNGTANDPHASLSLDLTRASLYGERVDRVDGNLEYANQRVDISQMRFAGPAGRIELRGSYSHAPSDFDRGQIELHVATSGIELASVRNVEVIRPGLVGTLRLTSDIAADLRNENGERKIRLSRVDANGGVSNLGQNRQRFGDVTFDASTKGDVVGFNLTSDIGKSAIQGRGQVQLSNDYPASAKLTFGNVRYSGIREFLSTVPGGPGTEALLEGTASFDGPILQPAAGRGEIQVSRLEVSDNGNMVLKNDGAITARLAGSAIQIQSARLTGPSANITIGGGAILGQRTLNITLQAGADMKLVKSFYPDAYSAGSVAVNSTIRGTFAQPLVNGRIELKDASLQLTDWPNGISNANGVILLNGANARIESFQARSGGGAITLAGFAVSTGGVLNLDLRANAKQIRTRYAGASVTADAALTLTGTSERSILSGTVTVGRVGYSQESDLGTLLSLSATPPHPPVADTGPLAGMRINIRVRTAPDVRFQTALAEQLSATADLTLTGSPATVGMVGRIDITGGTLIFFGNKYTVNRGSISFFDATRIQPVLDIDLGTSVQGVAVSLAASGPIDNLKLSYRSDPPLKFEDVVALLAAGKTPPDPTIAVNQPYAPDQSATQMGGSAILGQAVANPIASRLERVFGVSQFNIAPTFVSGSTLPQARVTLQQQVSNSITFTYSQDLSQTNSQLIRVELELSPRFSAVAIRDENGIFGVDFYYKKQFR